MAKRLFSAAPLLLIILIASYVSADATTPEPCPSLEQQANLSLSDVGVYHGGRLVSHTEFFSSHSTTYQSNMKCQWEVLIPNNRTLIHFKILSLDLEVHRRGFFSTCRYDNLTVKYKNAISNDWVTKVACSRIHLSYFTSTKDVTIWFNTDGSVTKRGFHLVWYLIPLWDAYRLPGLESWTALNCPPVSQDSGTLIVGAAGVCTECTWRWRLDSEHFMNIFIKHVDFDYRDNWRTARRCCYARTNKLILMFSNKQGQRETSCLCGNHTINQTIDAYGRVTMHFLLTEPVQGRGVRLDYQRKRQPKRTNCTELERVNRYQSIVTSLTRLDDGVCNWTIQPLSNDHFISLRINALFSVPTGVLHNCQCNLTVTGRTITTDIIYQWTSSKNTSSAAIFQPTQLERVICCDARYQAQFMFVGPVVKLSLGTCSVRKSWLFYKLDIKNIPVAAPGSARLCPPQKRIIPSNAVVETQNGSRLVSGLQVELTSMVDCFASVLLNPRRLDGSFYILGRQVRVSVNCSSESGYLSVVSGTWNVTTVACNSSANVPLSSLAAVPIEAVGTGGFTALLEELSWIHDGSENCPGFDTTRSTPSTVSLPLLPTGTRRGPQASFYCVYSIVPPRGKDVIVQLQMPLSSDFHKQFCSEISSHNLKAKLSFIISKPDGSRLLLSLCNRNDPGDLLMQSSIRLSFGESLEIDFTSAQLSNNTSYTSHRLWYQGADATVVRTPVEVCERLPSSGEQWQVSPDGTQLLSTVAVAPDNTQTDCNLQLDAPTAAGIANQSKFVNSDASKLSNVGCWNLEVKLDEFSTVCGLKQLVMTVSHWDSLAETVVHSQREICGSDSPVGFRIAARLQPAGSGMSLQYSGVRSGFRAQFSISACRQSPVLNEQLVDSPASVESVSPLFVGFLVVLAVANVCLALFIFRSKIRQIAQLFTGTSQQQPPVQTSPRTSGDDRVNLLNDVPEN